MNTENKRRRALVTGGAKGIGQAICQRLANEGFRVAVADIDIEEARHVAERLGGGHVAIQVDLTDPQAADALPAKAEAALGGLDLVVNNAGVTDSSGRTLLDLPQAAFDRLVAVNLTALQCVSEAAAKILSPGASIVNLASGAAYRPLALRGPYSATKAGVVEYTAALAAQLKERQISVVAIAPGYTLTPLVEELEREGRVDLKKVSATIPLGRLAAPQDIAAAVAFSASAHGRTINGQSLLVDGGGSMGPPPEMEGPPKGTSSKGNIVLLGQNDRSDLSTLGLPRFDALTDAEPLAAVVDAGALGRALTPAQMLEWALSSAKACAAIANRTPDFNLVFVVDRGESPSARAAAAALSMLSRTLALEWAGSGMRVNTVLWQGPTLEGLGELCRFMIGDDASYITGQVLEASGLS
ncbi:SDR family oxidoreductase [Rhizobium sp. L1K21]|uniref:SDR family oxidoreductase n=1 Tax=Rhizobium sp. L1K21 TaxID=2954933 RepID=UPI002093D111|nr:SDR family oxidoreductase [Rhizobium sp. L1K21]MCO6188486.1 SDR family oxidoreductase [Rhizobium sp. L1K21]